jgi:hypothetical protein
MLFKSNMKTEWKNTSDQNKKQLEKNTREKALKSRSKKNMSLKFYANKNFTWVTCI